MHEHSQDDPYEDLARWLQETGGALGLAKRKLSRGL